MKKIIFILISLLLIGCTEPFEGCGTVTKIYEPEPVYEIYYQDNVKYKLFTGKYNYAFGVLDNTDTSHKVYVAYDAYINYNLGDFICFE